jgi:large subunit ribosomal protein L40e
MSDSIAIIKKRLENYTGIKPDMQRLVFAGQRLDDSKTLQDYNVQHESTIHHIV